jgi:ubiquinol-cytochrome c reductase iron-sulfur subunit
VDQPPRRRDLLTTAALTALGVSGGIALWPFIAALQPADDVLAQRIIIDTKMLTGTALATINVDQTPVIIFRRTPEDLIALRTANPTLRDADSAASRQPEWAKNWHRSLRPDIMVCIGMCTKGDCIVRRDFAGLAGLKCPCCGSSYDLAGRIANGPAPLNLRVPAHRFISETEIEFAAAAIRSSRLTAPLRANRA